MNIWEFLVQLLGRIWGGGLQLLGIRQKAAADQLTPQEIDRSGQSLYIATGQKVPPKLYQVPVANLQILNRACAIRILMQIDVGFIPTELNAQLDSTPFHPAMMNFCEHKLGLSWQEVLSNRKTRNLLHYYLGILMEAELLHQKTPQFRYMDALYEHLYNKKHGKAELLVESLRNVKQLIETVCCFPIWLEIKEKQINRLNLADLDHGSVVHLFNVRNAYLKLEEMFVQLTGEIESNLAELTNVALTGDWVTARQGVTEQYFSLKDSVLNGSLDPSNGVVQLQQLREELIEFLAEVAAEYHTAADPLEQVVEHFETLGLDIAEVVEIAESDKGKAKGMVKKAYRKIALKFHPDRLAQLPKREQEKGEAIFKAASNAYEQCCDFLDQNFR